jgi:hypothetical protein
MAPEIKATISTNGPLSGPFVVFGLVRRSPTAAARPFRSRNGESRPAVFPPGGSS